MGTDRSNEWKGPCECGSGEYAIDFCEVDHAWPVAKPWWYECHVNCAVCRGKYQIKQRGRNFVLLDRAVVHDRDAKREAERNFGAALCKEPEVMGVLNAVAEMLAAQKSVAAVYRVLRGAGLVHGSENTFRRHWSGPEQAVKELCRPGNLMALFGLANANTEWLSEKLGALSLLQEAANEPVPPVGEPIYVLPNPA